MSRVKIIFMEPKVLQYIIKYNRRNDNMTISAINNVQYCFQKLNENVSIILPIKFK